MFDLRYHVASLAAVFIALVIGIVVGVGLSGRSVLREGERNSLEARIQALEHEKELQQARIDELAAAAEYERRTFDAVLAGRLQGRRILMVFVGPADGAIRTSVEETLERAGGSLRRARSLKVPVDALEVQDALADVPDAPERIEDVGRALAVELVRGGEMRLWQELGQLIVLEQPPGPPGRVDAVVVARTAEPQRGATARLLGGFYNGLASAAGPAVAVETTATSEPSLGVFQRFGFSGVDNVDTPTGWVSLAVLLAGGQPGQYGIDGADGYVPPVAPVQPGNG